ncbi:hypothetical protein EZV62_015991 [Acer yangbiense]|uniref:Uncharacterized protein n=1 Tax=Acer yangbiense TaxID=1000413 RepID=A0A5C7HPQ4_9ROSI|nr:hypothetical protein EZV62_015991 [Acer yangbiense]
MGVTLLLHKISSSLSTSQSHYSLLKAIQGLPVLELSSICINLTLLLVFLFIISARQIFVCAGRSRTLKDDYVVNSSPRRRSVSVDGEIRDVKIGTWFKMSLFCCFYVLFLQVLVLGFDGVGLIREAARGKVVDCSVLFMPVAQGLAWFVLSFSALHCKFKVSEKFPFLLRCIKDNKRKAHWLAWKKCVHQRNGETLFRDVCMFQAMLTKQGWKLLCNLGSLVARLRSVVEGCDDYAHILIYEDGWLPSPSSCRVCSPRRLADKTSVSTLMEGPERWNEGLERDLFLGGET